MRVKIISMLLVVVLLILTHNVMMSNGMSIEDKWLHSTVYIQNPSINKSGTGFFVGRQVSKDKYKIFLISNKHVLAPKPLKVDNKSTDEPQDYSATVKIFITYEENNEQSIRTLKVPIRNSDGADLWYGHPNKDVDVALINVTPYLVGEKTGELKVGYKVGFIIEEKFATDSWIKETFLTIGDRIVMLGYPLNMLEGGHSLPVARGGTIASPPNIDYKNLPVFLVDGSALRGASGSPVFVPVRSYTVSKDDQNNTVLSLVGGYLPRLLGVVSATIPDWKLIIERTEIVGLPPSKFEVIETANIGIVFRAETITQTIDQTGVIRWVDENDTAPEKTIPPKETE